MSSRIYFGAIQRDGFLEIASVDKEKDALGSMLLLKNASKIKFAEEVIKHFNNQEEPKKILKERVASDLRSRSKKQIKSHTKFFDSILSFLLGCFGYESTEKKINTAFSLINRKDYEIIDEKPEKPNSAVKKNSEEEKTKENENHDDSDLEKQTRQQAKDKADKEAKALAEKQAQENAEQKAKELAEQQAKEKADREAKALAEQKAKRKEEKQANAKAKAEKKIAEKQAREEEKKNIKLRFALQTAFRQEEIKKALDEDLKKTLQDLYNNNLEAFMHHLQSGDVEAIFNIIRALETSLQDPFLAYTAQRFSSNGNYFVARMFAVSISDYDSRMNCLAHCGLLNSYESLQLSQTSEIGKKIAGLLEQNHFEEALKSLEDSPFQNWIIHRAINYFLENGNFKEAEKYINYIQQPDLKHEYVSQLRARNDLIRIYYVLNGETVPHQEMLVKELGVAIQLLKEAKFSEAVEIALTFPTEMLSYFCTQLTEAYFEKGRYKEARDLVRNVDLLKNEKGFQFDFSLEEICRQSAIKLLLRGDIEEGLISASYLSDEEKLRLIDALLEYKVNASFPALIEILAPMQDQDSRWLKLIAAASDKVTCFKALPFIKTEIIKNLARLAIAAKFSHIDSLLECSDESLMLRSLDAFMNAFNEKVPTLDKKVIETLEAKVDALKDKELKKVLYLAVRSLFNRHPPDLITGQRIAKKLRDITDERKVNS